MTAGSCKPDGKEGHTEKIIHMAYSREFFRRNL